ncbi:MAG: DUF3175 domain-containing protein [Proteobacteria bacterium]|nr:DUF3175 domain-containing protein [Pseudomonadota bacterium]
MARTAKIRRAAHKTSHKSSTTRRRTARSKTKARGGRRWSQRVTRESDALTLEEGVFKKSTPRQIALSLKRSADRSKRRKSDPYRSAMSMLTFYINRAGKGLSKTRKARLQKAKDELREVYGRE